MNCLYRRREKHREECHVKMEAEIKLVQLQVKVYPGSLNPATTGQRFFPGPLEGAQLCTHLELGLLVFR
jgi:hypothetical protein